MGLTKRNANLRKYPEKIYDNSNTHVTIGDLHANAIKLIYILTEEGCLEISPEDYEKLYKIYITNVKNLTKEELLEFKKIISEAKINKEKRFVLIGDELADRGQNDVFILFILQKIYQEGLPVSILLSNHSAEFINDYDNETFTGFNTLGKGQALSLENLLQLINEGIIKEEEIRNIVENAYIPMVKAIDCSLNEQGELVIFSHAPIGLETIEALAIKLGIDYLDDSIDSLVNTINEINHQINIEFKEGRLSEMINEEQRMSNSVEPIPCSSPIQRLIWNRALGDELVVEPAGKFKVKFVHGHIGQGEVLKHGQEQLNSHENTDTNLGKNLFLMQTRDKPMGSMPSVHHLTRQTKDRPAYQIKMPKISYKDIGDFKEKIIKLKAVIGKIKEDLEKDVSNDPPTNA
jgi:hypothetical protein